MSQKRILNDWEKAECTALKELVDAYNQARPKRERITQEAAGAALGITQGAFSSYLNGRIALNKEIAAGISKLFGIPVERFSPRLAAEIASMAAATDHNNVASTIQPYRPSRLYPVLSEVPAGHPRESVVYLPQHAEERYPSTENAGPNGYWLRVDGPSMTSASHPSFPEGILILVQPEGFDLISGKFYIAQWRGADGAITATFKKYIKDCGNEYLVPLNPDFDTIRMDHDWDIIGRVVGVRYPDL